MHFKRHVCSDQRKRTMEETRREPSHSHWGYPIILFMPAFILSIMMLCYKKTSRRFLTQFHGPSLSLTSTHPTGPTPKSFAPRPGEAWTSLLMATRANSWKLVLVDGLLFALHILLLFYKCSGITCCLCPQLYHNNYSPSTTLLFCLVRC